MPRHKGDPRWLEARYDGKCGRQGCEEPIRKGDQVFYYPNGSLALAKGCGHADEASRDFEAHRQDEEGF